MNLGENISIAHLITSLSKSKILRPDIALGDRGPSWDGNILITHQDSKIGLTRFPIQVKSVRVKDAFSKKKRSYVLDKADLENYYADNGVMLFVIEYKSDPFSNPRCKIFYCELLPSDLKIVLHRHSKKDKITIPNIAELFFDTEQQVASFEEKCMSFVNHRILQTSTKHLELKLEEASELYVTSVNHISLLTNMLNDVSIYGYRMKNTAPIFIQKITPVAVQLTTHTSIILDAQIYYTESSHLLHNDMVFYIFGNTIRINLHSGEIEWASHGNIDQLIHDITFLIRLSSANELILGDNVIPASTIQSKETEVLQERLQLYLNIRKLCHHFHIPCHKLVPHTLNDKDIKNLNVILETLILQKPTYKQYLSTYVNSWFCIDIGPYKLAIEVYRDEDGNITIDNFFQTNHSLGNSSNPYSIKYLNLQKDDMLTISNVNMDVVLKDIMAQERSLVYYNKLYPLMLQVIYTYLDTLNTEFLQHVDTLISWVLKDQDQKPPLFVILQLQIKRHLDIFTIVEEEMCEVILEAHINDRSYNHFACMAHILLENKSLARKHFTRMTIKEQKEFQQHPIYALAMEWFDPQ